MAALGLLVPGGAQAPFVLPPAPGLLALGIGALVGGVRLGRPPKGAAKAAAAFDAAAERARAARAEARERAAEEELRREEFEDGLFQTRVEFEAARGTRSRGLGVPREQVLLAVAAFLLYDSDGKLVIAAEAHSNKERYAAAAKLSGLAPNTAKKYVELFRAAGEVVLEKPGERGPRKADAALLDALNEPVKEWVRKLLADKSDPIWITRKLIQDFIFEQSGVFASFKRISKLCDAWGLTYGRLQRAPNTRDPLRSLLRRVTLLDWSLHKRLGNKVIEMDACVSMASPA
jgi:transposase